jgi:SAM-dependent methyltransferase
VPEPTEKISAIVGAHLRGVPCPRVLDAGCGLVDHVGFGGNAWIVGIDTSQAALDSNTAVREKILGDVHTHPFDPESFDVVVAWDVLEHLPRPEEAMRNMLAALKPGGLMLIGVANPFSIKGLITRFTPHGFHVWAYRHLLGHPDAGLPGHAPFPVYLRTSLSPGGIRRFCMREGVRVELLEAYEGGQIDLLGRKHPALLFGFRLVAGLMHVLSLGAYDGRLTDTSVVIRKASAVRTERPGAVPVEVAAHA